MRLIKLNAIGSTNDYLKELISREDTANFTVVTAETQTSGRGQMGSKWDSKPGSNLTMSVLVKDPAINAANVFDLNVAVSAAIIRALQPSDIPGLCVKWPNDILSGKKKIGGVLIENTVRSAENIISIVGIGLNVNQATFENLPQASSLSIIMGKEFDKWQLLYSIIEALEGTVLQLHTDRAQLWESYISSLFKINSPMPFQDQHGKKFMGMIKGVAPDGQLRVQLEDDSEALYGLKQLTMLY